MEYFKIAEYADITVFAEKIRVTGELRLHVQVGDVSGRHVSIPWQTLKHVFAEFEAKDDGHENRNVKYTPQVVRVNCQ